MSLSDMSIGSKLAAVSAIGILLVAGMLASALFGNTSVRDAFRNAALQQLNARDVQAIQSEIRGMALSGHEFRIAESEEAMNKALEGLVGHKRRIEAITAKLSDNSSSTDVSDFASQIQSLTAKFEAAVRSMAAQKTESINLTPKALRYDIVSGRRVIELTAEMASIARDKIAPIIAAADEAVDKFVTSASRTAETDENAAQDTLISIERISIAISGGVILVLIGAAIFSALAIARPLRALVAPLQQLAQGNFAISVPGAGRKDEVGLIAGAAEAVVNRVGATIGNIKVAASEVTSASSEISSATTDLSQRTEEQAASLEETTASMVQIAATVRKNAEDAKRANDFAAETSAVAERGGAVVSDAVSAMAQIENSSHKISDIIGVIDEIARQTNLLALNAAVEAARAGEAGRGFAVVASEVRSLAQRSSQAAKDIKDLIVKSSDQVRNGVELVNKAGGSLNEIVASINKVAVVVAEIANASLEQSSGIEQINRALNQMDEVTQQNSALVEQNAATAKTLEEQARSMDQRVAAFRLRADFSGDAGEYSSAATAVVTTFATTEPATDAVIQSDIVDRPIQGRPKAPRRAVAGGADRSAQAAGLARDENWQEF